MTHGMPDLHHVCAIFRSDLIRSLGAPQHVALNRATQEMNQHPESVIFCQSSGTQEWTATFRSSQQMHMQAPQGQSWSFLHRFTIHDSFIAVPNAGLTRASDWQRRRRCRSNGGQKRLPRMRQSGNKRPVPTSTSCRQAPCPARLCSACGTSWACALLHHHRISNLVVLPDLLVPPIPHAEATH